MSDYNEGDLVEASLGETVIRGRVTGCSGDWLGNSRRHITGLIADGYTVTVIERAKPALPTEPGAYATQRGDVHLLTRDGRWLDFSLWGGSEWPEPPIRYAPFTRLEPVPETAKKVLDRLSSWWEFGPPQNFLDEFANIAAEFGVTGELGE